MLVDLSEVSVSGKTLGTIAVNPRHVAYVKRAVNSNDPDAQAFTSELFVVGFGKVNVEGSQSEVRTKLNGRAAA